MAFQNTLDRPKPETCSTTLKHHRNSNFVGEEPRARRHFAAHFESFEDSLRVLEYEICALENASRPFNARARPVAPFVSKQCDKRGTSECVCWEEASLFSPKGEWLAVPSECVVDEALLFAAASGPCEYTLELEEVAEIVDERERAVSFLEKKNLIY